MLTDAMILQVTAPEWSRAVVSESLLLRRTRAPESDSLNRTVLITILSDALDPELEEIRPRGRYRLVATLRATHRGQKAFDCICCVDWIGSSSGQTTLERKTLEHWTPSIG